MLPLILKSFTCALCAVSALFFMIGAIGYSDDEDTIKNVFWMKYEEDSINLDVWYGLHSFTFSGNVYGYDGSDCSGDTCNKCESDGKTALGCLIVATIACLVALACHGMMIMSADINAVKVPALVFTVIGFIAPLIAVGTFMGSCYASAVDDIDNGSFYWGPGSNLSIAGMFLMLFATGLTVWQLCLKTGDQQQSLSANAQTGV